MSVIGIRPDIFAEQQSALTRKLDRLTQQLSSGKRVQTAADDPAAWREAEASNQRLQNLSAINDSLTSFATSFRGIEHLTKALGSYMTMLQGEWQAVKDLGTPPATPQAAADRQVHIQRYNDLKKQMDELVNDNPDQTVRALTGDPAQVQNTGNLQVLTGENGFSIQISSRELHTGPNGLNIQSMPANPTEQDLHAVADNLAQARSRLQDRTAAFGLDEASITRAQSDNTKSVGKLQSRVDDLVAADLNQTAAELQSLQTQQMMLVNSGRVVNSLKSALLDLFR